jgi:hypothetical protein
MSSMLFSYHGRSLRSIWMHIRLYSLILWSMGIFFLTSCSPHKDTDRFIRTYTHVLMARESEPNTTQATVLVKEVLTQAGYTEESFRAEFESLARQPETFRTILDSARLYARRLGDSLHRTADSLRHRQDSTRRYQDSLRRMMDSVNRISSTSIKNKRGIE